MCFTDWGGKKIRTQILANFTPPLWWTAWHCDKEVGLMKDYYPPQLEKFSPLKIGVRFTYFILRVRMFCLNVCLHTTYMLSPGTAVMKCCEPLHEHWGSEPRPSARAASAPDYWVISPAPRKFLRHPPSPFFFCGRAHLERAVLKSRVSWSSRRRYSWKSKTRWLRGHPERLEEKQLNSVLERDQQGQTDRNPLVWWQTS